jgi:hypothetical protein
MPTLAGGVADFTRWGCRPYLLEDADLQGGGLPSLPGGDADLTWRRLPSSHEEGCRPYTMGMPTIFAGGCRPPTRRMPSLPGGDADLVCKRMPTLLGRGCRPPAEDVADPLSFSRSSLSKIPALHSKKTPLPPAIQTTHHKCH